MKSPLLILTLAGLMIGCRPTVDNQRSAPSGHARLVQDSVTNKFTGYINPAGTTLSARIRVPEGYERVGVTPGSFQEFLQNFPLKPHGSKVHYYNGRVKDPEGIYVAVLDLDVGDKDLQQCADAIMRLRAEYLYSRQEFNAIHFNFTNGFRADYKKWAEGNRIRVNGNSVSWRPGAPPGTGYSSFRDYLEQVFMYAGTWSLSQELLPADIQDLQIGDIFIQGGSPGHAVIVMDVAKHPVSGQTVFLLAQSYMPAQEVQILENPKDESLSPWYEVRPGTLLTPEWRFDSGDLKRFE